MSPKLVFIQRAWLVIGAARHRGLDGGIGCAAAISEPDGWTSISFACVIAEVLSAGVAVVRIQNPFAGLPDETRSTEIVDAVIGNVHTAYLERADPKLGKALSIVVAGDGTRFCTSMHRTSGRAYWRSTSASKPIN